MATAGVSPVDYLLPQHDDNSDRAEALSATRRVYSYSMDYGVPTSKGYREQDEPGELWQARLLLKQELLHLNMRSLVRNGKWKFTGNLPELKPLKLLALLKARDFPAILNYFTPKLGVPDSNARATSIDDFRAVFARAPLPEIHRKFDTDEGFADNFVAGLDPTRLQRMERFPEKFPITTEHLATVPSLAGEDLAPAIRAGRVYWVDYEANAGLDNSTHPLGTKYVYAPIIAFAVPRNGGSLLPFAIQCGQDPAGRQIYTPADGYSWKIARNCVLVAHNCYHEIVTHLGLTHLLSEPVLLSTLRNLSHNHPLSALLQHHFEGTININRLAVDLLIQPGEAVEIILGGSLSSLYELLGEERLRYSYRDNYLPERLKRHRTDDRQLLRHYPYRDDGLPVWNAIAGWMTDFVGAYYKSDDDVRADVELQAWAQEISSPDWGRVAGFGATPGAVADRHDLVEILTMVLWTAGPQHAAVNFPQGDRGSFLPANPQAGFAPEPNGTGHTDTDWLDTFPPIDIAIQQFNTLTLLSALNHTVLGRYGNTFTGTKAAEGEKKFGAALKDIEAGTKVRNKGRFLSYPYLIPSQIPNSTNI